jgi:serine/threonine protein phosphatase PrpC
MRKKDSEFETGYYTETGLTPTNKGHFAHIELEDFACWVVAEKLDSCEEKNSAEIVVKGILDDFIQKPSLSKSRIKQYLENAHNKLISESKKIMLRSSLAMVVTDYSNIVWAVAGNVRLYHFRQGRFNFRSKDQTMAQLMLDAGNLGEEEINSRNERNALINYLGISTEFKPWISSPYPLEDGDQIIFGTLGFWENLKTSEITQTLSALDNSEECTAKLREALLNRETKPARNYLIAVISMSRIAKGTSFPFMGLLRKIAIFLFLVLLGGIGFLFNQGANLKIPLIPRNKAGKVANAPVKSHLKSKKVSIRQSSNLQDISPAASIVAGDAASQTGQYRTNEAETTVSARSVGGEGDSQINRVGPKSNENRIDPEETEKQREAEKQRKQRIAAEQARKQREAEEQRKQRIAAEQARKRREAEEQRKQRIAAEQARKQREAEELRKQRIAAEQARKQREAEELRKQRIAAEQARKQREAEEQRKQRIAAEQARKQQEAEEQRKQRIAAEQARKQQEAEEERKQRAAAEREKILEEARRLQEAEEWRRSQAIQEAGKQPEAEETGKTQETKPVEKPDYSSTVGPNQKEDNSLDIKLNQARTWEKAGDEKYSAEQYDEALKLYKMARNVYRELGRNREVTALDYKINDTINKKLLFQIKRGLKGLSR